MRHTPRTLLVALAAGAVLAAGCSGDDGEATDSSDGAGSPDAAACPVDALEDAGAPVEIEVWHSYISGTKKALEDLAQRYNDSQDRVQVTIQSQGRSYEELLRQYQAATESGDLPAIAVLEDTVTQLMADGGTVIPGQACFEADPDGEAVLDDLLPVVRESYSVDGDFYPVSVNVSTLLMYFNREHFRAAGLDPDDPPQTLDDLRTAAQAILDSGVTAGRPPLVLKLASWLLEWWLSGVGQPLVDQDNGQAGHAQTSELDNPSTIQVMGWLQQMEADGLLNTTTDEDGSNDHYLSMATQSSSMIVETSTAVTTVAGVLEGTLTPEELQEQLGLNVDLPALSLDIGVAPYPGLEAAGQGQVGGGAWYLSNTGSAQEQAAAWDFARFVNGVESQIHLTLAGSYIPAFRAVAQDPAIVADWGSGLAGPWRRVAYDVLLDANTSDPRPLIGPYAAVRDQVEDTLEAVVVGGQPVDEAVTQLDAAVTTLLEEYGG